MSTAAPNLSSDAERFEVIAPDVSGIAIDDDEPVDDLYVEKQQRLLTEPLHTSWRGPPPRDDAASRPFIAAANVGVFATPHDPPLVPDVFVSLDVALNPAFTTERKHRTYFVWEHGKPPDVVIEVVSNRTGDELGKRKLGYARMRVAHYAVWDLDRLLGGPELVAFELRGDLYVPMARPFFEVVGLGLAPWEGEYEAANARWLRWCGPDGEFVATGAERARAAETRAQSAEDRAQRLAALLRAHGIDFDEG